MPRRSASEYLVAPWSGPLACRLLVASQRVGCLALLMTQLLLACMRARLFARLPAYPSTGGSARARRPTPPPPEELEWGIYDFSGLLEDIQPRRHAAAPPRESAFPLAALVIVGGVGPPAHLGHSVVEQLAHPEPSMVAALQSASPKAPPLWFNSQDTPPRVIAKTWRRHPQLLPLLLPQSPCRASGPIRRSHLWPWPDALLRSDSRTICCC